MDPKLELRLRNADPVARRTPDDAHDQDWLRETARSVTTRTARSRRPRALVLGAAAAALVLAAAAGGFLLRGIDDGEGGGATDAAPTVVDFTLPPDDMMASCIAFSVETLAPMQVAFGGEVVEKSDGEILIDVATWYRGGDSDQVRLTAPDISITSLGGSIDFQVGSRYLVTAAAGNINYCGFSGPWTQSMADAFAAAFGPGQ